MTREECRQLIAHYIRVLADAHHADPRLQALDTLLPHMLGMVEAIPDDAVRHYGVEKFHRWLGFVQGVLWTYDLIDMNEISTRNRTAP